MAKENHGPGVFPYVANDDPKCVIVSVSIEITELNLSCSCMIWLDDPFSCSRGDVGKIVVARGRRGAGMLRRFQPIVMGRAF